MAESRARMQATYGNMITYHDEYNGGDGNRERHTNTFKSNISFSDPTASMGGAKTAQTRQRQFEANPVQPGATRQSYQGSDIFGTQGKSEMVQKSAQVNDAQRPRDSRTFARSDVMGNDEAAIKGMEGGLHHQSTTRKEQNWNSNVFAQPKQERLVRKNQEPGGAGRGGLYGDQGEDFQWQRKANLAGVVSQRVDAGPAQVDTTRDYDRKNRELHGNSSFAPAAKRSTNELMTSAADWRNPQQTYTTAKDEVPSSLGQPYEHDQQRKARKAAQLQSNVLTHQDDELRQGRTAQFDATGETRMSHQASNANWSAQTGYQKPTNAGAVDAYRMRQNQLKSNVLEQTDYDQHAPMQKKQIVDADNYNYSASGYKHGSPTKKGEKAIESKGVNWLGGGKAGAEKVNNRPGEYDVASKRQGFLQSQLDGHSNFPDQAGAREEKRNHDAEYQAKNQYFIPASNNAQKVKLMNQTSNILGHDVEQYWKKENLVNDEGATIDFDLQGLPGHCQEADLKRAAGVKHVISSVVSIDNFTGQCKGDGRLRVRLSAGETEQAVKNSLSKHGYWVKEHQENPKKNTGFSGPPKDDGKPKNSKQHEMMSKQPIA